MKIVPGVRLNLSKGGASVSFGVRGLRHTIGAKGTRTTVGIPGSGLSWTSYAPRSQEVRRTSSGDPRPQEIAHEAFTPITSADTETIGALSTSELAPILTQVQRRVPIASPLAIGAAILLTFLLYSQQREFVGVAVVLGVFALLAIPLDWYRRSIAITYEPSGIAAEAAEALSRAFESAANCAAIWRVEATAHTGDWKRNAGATRLNKRQATRLAVRRPRCIRGRVRFPCVDLGTVQLYLLPDAALVVSRSVVTALSYGDLDVAERQVQFIEDGSAPRDAEVVGYTWRYVNKRGGPDRRFNNNKQLPICLYSELDFQSVGGLNGRLHLSRSGAGSVLPRVVEAVGAYLASSETPRVVTAWKQPRTWPTFLFIALLSLVVSLSLLSALQPSPSSNSDVHALPGTDATVPFEDPTGQASADLDVHGEPTIDAQYGDDGVGGPLVIVTPEVARDTLSMPLPRLRPRRE